ncbi:MULTISPECIES: SusC/RagA family TonB-linked outer membrane protein [Olivibacter]|jgi:TonB-linked SusC/RagA family outer membrane protein|uniref:SusC/RagA family TonB-linked outer membrane protein n=1 Tax=Olivibacter oleidegradans TaxID=760123 RepID=A0ABV6HI59_9SPHI|nr:MULTISPECIES: TonB-dependent receptor [Olivibacter]QEL01447.1 TonB-dependent receptor [Olivibacter sp. LS-1]
MEKKTNHLTSKILAFLLMACSTIGELAAQTIRMQGKVVDEKNAPLAGVSVRDTVNRTGVTTDLDGHFSIMTNSGSTLTFSLIGYLSQNHKVNGRQHLTITLKEDISALDEVVVIGYGTMKKSSVTAAVSKLENKNLDQIPLARPEAALQGRLAGVNVSQTRSAPGSAPLIRIRGGSGSIDAGNSPLVVVDGFPGGSFANVNMNDVESIEVLKDASSAAIYGSRGAGGVIIITTKRGKTGKPVLNINANGGVSTAMGHDDWLDKDEYYAYAVRYQNREFNYVGGDTSIPVWGDNRRPPQYQVSDALRNNANTNWQDALLSPAPFQNYDLSVSGGTENVKYYASAIIKDVQGTLKNTWFKSYGARANVDVKVNDRVNMGLMLNPNYTRNRLSPHAMIDLVKYPPFVPVQNPDGSYPKARDYWGLVVSGQTNPMAFMEGSFYFDDAMTTIGEMYASIDLAKGLKIKSSIGTTISYSSSDRFRSTWGSTNGISIGTASDSRTINLLNENVLSYNKDFNNHHFDAILGASYQRATSRSSAMGAVPGSFNNDIIHTLNNAIIDPAQTRTSKTEWGLVSYFSRVHYAYKDKYLLSASMRTDASSRFGPNNKWGWFPSASLAWRVSQEEFMKSLSAISDLKLRASYGSTGNFNIGNFDYLGQIGNTYYSPNNELSNAQVQTTLGNPSLSWEKTQEYDFGIDLGLWANRLNLTVDYYQKTTSNLLYNVSIPAITGFTSWLTNIGKIRNQGIELELTSRNFQGGSFSWSTSFNLAHNKNKVIDLGGLSERLYTDRFGMSWLLRLGEPMFSYYGYQAIGVLQNQEEVANTPVLSGSKPGNPKYQDVNDDGRINPEDRVILGSYMPKTILGLVNDFSWKNFDLSIAIQASLGAKIYNFENQYYQGNVLGAMRRSLVEGQWWSEQEPGDGKMPAAALSQLEFQANSSIYIENASFLAVRNVNFGYTFSEHLANKLKMKKFRLYTSINNLFMITDKNFHGYNPEGYTAGEIDGINSTPGYNSGSEPVNRIFTLGLNVNF